MIRLTLFILLLSTHFANADMQLLDRYCVKQVDNLRLFYVNGMFTSLDYFRKNLFWLDNFQDTQLNGFKKGRAPTGSYNKDEELHLQVYEVAQQKYADLSPLSKKYQVITAILGGTIDALSESETALIEIVLREVFNDVTYASLSDTDYNNAYQRLLFQMHSCNRVILIGHSQGNFYTNALFEEIIASYQYSDGYYAADYPLVSLASIATPTSSLGGSLGEQYGHLISHLTLDQDAIMRAVRVLFGSLPSNYSAASLFDSTGHGLIEAYMRSSNVASRIGDDITHSVTNQTPFPLYEQHPVSSAAFSHIGYSSINKVLDLKFESGAVYRYFDIPILLWDDFYYSTSMGKFFNQFIRGRYSFELLDSEHNIYMQSNRAEPFAVVE